MIAVLGSINADLIANAARLPLPAETILGTGFATAAGGKGANQALAALRAGARMRLTGAVGDDAFAAIALAELEREGADLSSVARLKGATGVALIIVGGDGENVIVLVPGANSGVTPAMAGGALAALERGDTLVLNCEIPVPAVEAALIAARTAGVRTLLNIAPVLPESRHLASLADIVIANETELVALTGVELSNAEIPARISALAATGKQTIIVTLGADGALAATPRWSGAVPSPQIVPLDTVGAGDTFCGYLGAALDAGLDLEAALRRATHAGALACLTAGAQPSIPDAAAVDALIASGVL